MISDESWPGNFKFTIFINLLLCDCFVYTSSVRTCNVLIVRGHEISICIEI